MKTWIYLFSIAFSLLFIGSTIKGNGQINFDANLDGSHDAVLNSTGLGIGESTPTEKLHVSGNMSILHGNIGVNQSNPNHSLGIQGSLGLNVHSLSSNSAIPNTSSVILADTSSGNITLQLPTAADVDGRIYYIKKKDDGGKVFVSGGLIDGSADITLTTQSSPLPFLEIISHDSQWFILSGNGFELGLSGNLLAWWTFDATSGNQLLDRTGNGNSGNLQNFDFSSNTTTGRMGNALSFDGVDDYIDLGNADNLFVVDRVTIAVWHKVFSNDKNIFEKSGSFGSTHYTLMDDGYGGDPQPRWIVYDSGFTSHSATADSINEIDTVNWHHIVARYDGSNTMSDIWINGVRQADVESPDGTLSGTVASRRYTFIGASDFNGGLNNYFLGYMDDLRIYDKALSDAEVVELFNSGNSL